MEHLRQLADAITPFSEWYTRIEVRKLEEALDRPRIYVDFNEMVERDLVLLSKTDSRIDSAGVEIRLHEGKRVFVYTDDADENGRPDPLLATGIVERNEAQDWSRRVPWCCRLDGDGYVHASELLARTKESGERGS